MNRYHDWIITQGLECKQYQTDGVKWCSESEHRENGPQGGFLADEMGLGKTITMIGLFIVNFVPKTLIVLPAVLVDQWKDQLYKITGHKALIWKKGISDEDVNKSIIIITTYGKISITKKRCESILHKIHWNRIVFDEAHHLRNKKTCNFIGAKLLKGDARWFVSGTPIQNRLKDFYSLCSILGIPSSKFDNPSEIIEEYLLRRTKQQVELNRPEMILEEKMVVWQHEGEKKLSEEIHSTLNFSNVEPDKCKEVACALNDGIRPVLKMMIRAKQSCTLPKLLSNKINYLITRGIIQPNHLYADGIKHSSKMDSLVDTILLRKDNGNGKLIFCQFHEEIDSIVRMLREKGVYDVIIFDGRTTLGKRKAQLTEKHAILILQIQTGCEGLNLQEHYNEIYFASPHWNPSVEDQAIARCHRMGQTKQVQVFRFIMQGWGNIQGKEQEIETISFDKYVSNVQENKRKIVQQHF